MPPIRCPAWLTSSRRMWRRARSRLDEAGDKIADLGSAVTHLPGGEIFQLLANGPDDGVFDRSSGGVFAEEIEHHLSGSDSSERIDDVLAGILWSAATNRLEHRGALGIDVAPRGDAHAALDHRAQVRDDIAKHVVGDD